MDSRSLKQALTGEARRLGFERVGFAAAAACRDHERVTAWLANGRHGDMAWMARDVERRTDPRRLLPGARTVVALLTPYWTLPGGEGSRWIGRVSRYAWGRDYHRTLGRRLRKLARFLREQSPGVRVVTGVDHRPFLEKEWAERAGLGWIGKHTNLITEDAGSWFLLSELVTDVDLPPDDAARRNRCGRCTDCLRACPTGAIVAPYQVDARRCISYLTIECKGPIPRELRLLVGEWIFGCDVCQDVCPWNRFAVPVTDPRFALDEGRFHGDLADFLTLSHEEFVEHFQGSPVRRAGRDGFLRNVCVALGNRRDPGTLPALVRALGEDASALVRAHAAWAIGRLGGAAAAAALRARRGLESDAGAREEIEAALRDVGDAGRNEKGEASRPRPRKTAPAISTSSPSPDRN